MKERVLVLFDSKKRGRKCWSFWENRGREVGEKKKKKQPRWKGDGAERGGGNA